MTLLGAQQAQFDIMVKFMDNAPFMQNLMLSHLPQTGCTVNGFADSLTNPPTIYINRSHASPSTLIHELLHLLTHQTFNQHTSSRLNEGVTEYFTRKVQGAADPIQHQAFKTPRQSYPVEHTSINATHSHIKDVINPNLPFLRAQPIALGRHRAMAFA